MRRLLLLALLLPLTAHADNTAAGFYGLLSPQWPCDASFNAFSGKSEIGISFLDNTFGTDTRCYERYLADPRTKRVHINLINEVCAKYPRCGPYEALASLTTSLWKRLAQARDPAWLARTDAFVRQAADRLLPALNRRPDVKCYWSPLLESQLAAADGKAVMFDRNWNVWSSRCQAVWNGAQPIGGTLFERHGNVQVGPGQIANLDGAILNQSGLTQFIRNNSRAELAIGWILPFNGNCRGGAFVDPRQRTCWPSAQDFAGFGKAMGGSGQVTNTTPAPQPQPQATGTFDAPSMAGCAAFNPTSDGAKRDFVWKQSDHREIVAVLFPTRFNKQKFKVVKAIGQGGSVVDTFKYYYGYSEDKSYRQVWRGSLSIANYPVNIVLHADNQCWLLPDPRLRSD